MGATAAVHPTDQTLQLYGLGKLDDASAESVNKHLEDCVSCQRPVAEMSSDSFLGRLRDAQAQPGSSGPIVSSLAGLSMLDTGPSAPALPLTNSLPPGLAEHSDYEILRELGHGGMGTVYLALNRLMGRHEVLKVVSSHLMNRRGVLDRFQGEIRNAGRLHHTNIVTAYSATRIGESIVFAMEYVEGLDLAKLVKAKGALPVSNACNYVHQAALGLQYAHELGMVHRDIKPCNLMLARQGNRAVIKVLDFGLAKVRSEGAVDGGLTHEGQMLGTPDYIAPEQIRDARDADIRADIYSLGCTLYHLLTGGPPFQATSLYEILQAHHSMDALPLNLARPEVPVELAVVVSKMMAKEPERRFQTPREVAQALQPFFKARTASTAVSKAAMSAAGETDEGHASTGVRSASTQPAVRPTSAVSSSLNSRPAQPGPEPVWDSLIELKQTEPSERPAATVAESARPPRWLWPSISVGSLLIGFLIAWAVIIRVKTKDGEIVVRNVPEQAEASVDGERLRLKLPGKREPVEITTAPNGSGVSVRDGGTEATGAEVNIGTADGNEINAGFEPQVATSPEEKKIKEINKSPDAVAEGEHRPFNGQDFRGWNGLRNNQVVDPSSVFNIEGGELIWAGTKGRIFMEKALGDFSLKFEYLFPLNGRHKFASCLLKLSEGEPYQIGQANYRVSEVGCWLANSELASNGDIVSFEYKSRWVGGYVSPRRADTARPSDQWNEVEIQCEGRVIRFFLNGREVNRVEGNRAITCQPGFHCDGTDIRIRNLRIAPLTKPSLGPTSKKPGRSKAQESSASRKSARTKVADAFQARSTWEGAWTFEDPGYSGRRNLYKLIVTERSGNRFNAESVFYTDTSPIQSRVEGTIQGDRIEYEEVGEESFRFSSLGTLLDNEIKFKFQGTGTAGNARFGKGEITLQKR
jgi:serine/threonine protein kinase